MLTFSEEYLKSERRHNYTLSKPYFELIATLKNMFKKAHTSIKDTAEYYCVAINLLKLS